MIGFSITTPFRVRLGRALRRKTPQGLALVFIMATLVPFHLPDFIEIRPQFILPAIFFWGIYRPDLFGPLSAFLTGLLKDLLDGVPPGLNALTFLLVFLSARGQRRFFAGKPFEVSWWGYSIVAAGALSLKWALVSLLGKSMIPFEPVLYAYLTSLCLFPLIWVLCGRTQNRLLAEI